MWQGVGLQNPYVVSQLSGFIFVDDWKEEDRTLTEK